MASGSKEPLLSRVSSNLLDFTLRKLPSLKTSTQTLTAGKPWSGVINQAAVTKWGAELSSARFIAGGAEARARAADYRDSAERVRKDLMTAKEQLEHAIQNFERAGALGRHDEELAQGLFSLARIQTALGNHDEAEEIYKRLCPNQYNIAGHSPSTMTLKLEKYQLKITLVHLEFLLKYHRNIRSAEWLCAQLIGQLEREWEAEEQYRLYLCIIGLLNNRGRKSEAVANISRMVDHFPEALTYGRILVGLALASAKAPESKANARQNFLLALVWSAIIYGTWHDNTLDVLYAYGVALKAWNEHHTAAVILGECCFARYYRLGKSHPESTLTYNMLKTCDGVETQIEKLKVLDDPRVDDQTKLSMAYKHTQIDTIFDLPLWAAEDELKKIEENLHAVLRSEKPLKIETAEHRSLFILRVRRTLASCLFEQGKLAEAAEVLKEQNQNLNRDANGDFKSMLDLARIFAKEDTTRPKAVALSRIIFFDVDTKLHKDQAQGFRLKLTELGLTHFPYDSIVNNPLPIKVIDNVGTGAYAVVESVDISGRLYARKSIALPRYNQRRVRQTIQNEISVIHSLAHRHIVKIHCTYEEKTRFCLVLEPLATYDLEAYLEQYTQRDNYKERRRLRWKWLRCLANTLAFIHSKGIRHKDIKTRNILVKAGTEVVFADFGSSHAFLDEGNSTTEGPAFGHTLMYCAPEVESWDKRSRSADIFSLGCVFTEIATSLNGTEISDYYEFRCKEVDNSNGRETHAYHATLSLVDAWFDTMSEDMKQLYLDVIKPMLSQDPKARPTALSVSRAVECCFKRLYESELSACSKCQFAESESESATLRSQPTW
jgi:serine/threonine protein kinase